MLNTDAIRNSDLDALNKAAEAGDEVVLAQYCKGKLVKRDDVESEKWFLKSAKQGYPRAMYFLVTMYEDGAEDVSQDISG